MLKSFRIKIFQIKYLYVKGNLARFFEFSSCIQKKTEKMIDEASHHLHWAGEFVRFTEMEDA